MEPTRNLYVNEAAGLTAPVIAADDLIVNKLASGQELDRLQDLADVQAIRNATKARKAAPDDSPDSDGPAPKKRA